MVLFSILSGVWNYGVLPHRVYFPKHFQCPCWQNYWSDLEKLGRCEKWHIPPLSPWQLCRDSDIAWLQPISRWKKSDGFCPLCFWRVKFEVTVSSLSSLNFQMVLISMHRVRFVVVHTHSTLCLHHKMVPYRKTNLKIWWHLGSSSPGMTQSSDQDETAHHRFTLTCFSPWSEGEWVRKPQNSIFGYTTLIVSLPMGATWCSVKIGTDEHTTSSLSHARGPEIMRQSRWNLICNTRGRKTHQSKWNFAWKSISHAKFPIM